MDLCKIHCGTFIKQINITNQVVSLRQVYRPVHLYNWAAKFGCLQSSKADLLLKIRQISALNRHMIGKGQV